MIDALDFIELALKKGYDFWTGVPCSFIKPLINCAISNVNTNYIAASSEGEAVGIAAGAHLAGKKTVVMLQNSGLGNTVNPLTSLNFPFRIPTLLIITHRGAPGLKDEPQHELMGQITGDLLNVLRIPWEPFPDSADKIEQALKRADEYMSVKSLPFAFIMAKGAVNDYKLQTELSAPKRQKSEPVGIFSSSPENRMRRIEAIQIIKENLIGKEAIIATTGKIGRELFSLGHENNQIYMVGSMGCASGIGLGVHQGIEGKKRVLVLDGDGAVLMKMGTLATIGHYLPQNFTHIVLDNEAHDSTGGQATVSSTADIAGVACACGYKNIWRADTRENLAEIVAESKVVEGPSFIHVKIAKGSDPNLGRPTLTPVQIKEQFMAWLRDESA